MTAYSCKVSPARTHMDSKGIPLSPPRLPFRQEGLQTDSYFSSLLPMRFRLPKNGRARFNTRGPTCQRFSEVSDKHSSSPTTRFLATVARLTVSCARVNTHDLARESSSRSLTAVWSWKPRNQTHSFEAMSRNPFKPNYCSKSARPRLGEDRLSCWLPSTRAPFRMRPYQPGG